MASKDDSGTFNEHRLESIPIHLTIRTTMQSKRVISGQADPNNQWSIFDDVLEAVSGR